MGNLEEIRGRIVFPEGDASGFIKISDGIISACGPDVSVADADLLVFPGFFDIHVHAREFPLPENPGPDLKEKWERATAKETFATCGKAAVNGGVTLMAAMPNDAVPPDNESTYLAKKLLTENSVCPVIPYAVITRNSEPWADVPYKAYLDAHASNSSFSAWDKLAASLARYQGCRVFFHAEDPEILKTAPRMGPRWVTRPAEAEIAAVQKILELTAKYGIKTHICHISTEHAVELIKSYNRTSSIPITCEVTPHHLFFSIMNESVHAQLPGMLTNPELMGSNPPLRSESDREFLVEALKTGLIDILATDHAPHTLADKAAGAPGVPHLDTLGLFTGWLIKSCGFTAKRIAEVLSEVPGKLFASDIPAPYGQISEGYTASFSILDLGGSFTVRDSSGGISPTLFTKCNWSPFTGITFPVKKVGAVIQGRTDFL